MSLAYSPPRLSTTDWSHGLDIANSRLAAGLLFVTMAISHYVLREPAPYDLALIATAGLLFMLGLRIPRGIALPAAGMILILCGYMIGGTRALYVDMSVQFLQTSTYLTMTFIFFASVIAASPDRALRAIWAGYMVAGVSAAALGIGAYLNVIPGGDVLLGAGRAKALFEDPNVYGPFLVPPVLYGFWRMSTRSLRATVFFWGPVTVVLALGLFLSFSRGAWLHLLTSAFLFAVLASMAPETRGQRTRIAGIALLLGTAMFFAIGWAATIPEVRDLLEARLGLQSYDVREGGRFSGQLEALKHGLNNPFGIGPNNWGLINGLDTHNIYLNVFVAGGFISVLGLMTALVATLFKGFRYAMNGPRRGVFLVAFCSFVGLFAESIIIDSNHWRHMYLLLGMVWGLMLAAPPDETAYQKSRA
jgi:hypothetical protein